MRVAMIGAGGIAARHLQALEQEPEVEVVAHLAKRKQSAERAARRWGGSAYSDLETLLDEARPDAVWVTVPPAAHGPVEFALIERGVPMFIEKPLSADLATAREVSRRLGGSGLVTAVGYQWRALDTLVRLREVLEDRPPCLVTGVWEGSLPPPRWWWKVSSSGVQMVEQATHLLDLARHLCGPAHVLSSAVTAPSGSRPEVDVPAASVATLRYQTGAVGNFWATNVLSRTAFVGLQLVCEGLLVTVTRDSVTYDDGDERLEVRASNDPFAAINHAFLEAIRDGEPGGVHCSYADALRTHELLFDIVAAEDRPGAGKGL